MSDRQIRMSLRDFFLPLLSRGPSALGIKNKDGETLGQILGWAPPDSAEEEEEDKASRENRRQKPQGELEDQWNGRRSLGHLKDTSQETQEPESFSARTDHLAWENAQKCQQQLQQHEAEGACRPPQAEGTSLSWWQQEKEQWLFREARAEEEELCERPSRARPVPRATPHRAGRGSLWHLDHVPRPHPGGGDPEAMAAVVVVRARPPLEEQVSLRVQCIRWHPDHFLQLWSQIETRKLGQVMVAVIALSQALNHSEALK
ncbi:LOW QUALITY PROTEIN: NF-kappa-B inhibitor-like protein 1 [Glossophaga mutica]